jgi:hypothetical protein
MRRRGPGSFGRVSFAVGADAYLRFIGRYSEPPAAWAATGRAGAVGPGHG